MPQPQQQQLSGTQVATILFMFFFIFILMIGLGIYQTYYKSKMAARALEMGNPMAAAEIMESGSPAFSHEYYHRPLFSLF